MRIAVLVSLCCFACNRTPPASPPAPVSSTPRMPAHGGVSAGAPVPAGSPTPLADVIARPDDFAGKTLLVEGTVKAACSKRGCWMELAADGGGSCRVRFKDYGFFVPTDSAGAHARLAGEVKVRTFAPDEVAHYAAEGATLAKGPDGTARAVEITATGVELMKL